jgi:folate-dependent tRNA-U54 methylase TrmFO/GidA
MEDTVHSTSLRTEALSNTVTVLKSERIRQVGQVILWKNKKGIKIAANLE